MPETIYKFGGVHETTIVEAYSKEAKAYTTDRRAAWAFMRELEDLGLSPGYPALVDGVWTVRTLGEN